MWLCARLGPWPSSPGALRSMTMTTDSTVTTERRGRVLLIRIDRPQKRNAIDAVTTAGLDAALNLLDDDPDLWAGVLAGTPEACSAGPELAAGARRPDPRGRPRGWVPAD